MILIMGLVLTTGALIAMGGWDGYAPIADARATFRVIDTGGVPVTNALIRHCFHNNRTPDKERLVEKYTGTNGYAIFEGETSGGLTYRVQKDGYYLSDGKYTEWQEKWMPPDSPNIKKGRWQPWNPTFDVVLKEIKNPVAMYVKTFRVMIPVENTAIGFDLEKGDWVAPYGAGVNKDFLFTLSRRIENQDDFENKLSLTFPKKGDGVQEVMASPVSQGSLRLPYEASLNGYQSNWIRQLQYKLPQGFSFDPKQSDDRNYFFRVRTVLDKDGNVVSALYGKIHGEIDFAGYIAEKSTLMFTYYLNPTPNDRNVEFDPDKNLFGGRDRFAP